METQVTEPQILPLSLQLHIDSSIDIVWVQNVQVLIPDSWDFFFSPLSHPSTLSTEYN